MTIKEIKSRLGLPAKTKTQRMNNAAIRLHCGGGNELLDTLEWISGVANSARTAGNHERQQLADQIMERIESIRFGMLVRIERQYGLPPGTLTREYMDE